MALAEYYDEEGAKVYDIQAVNLGCFQKCLFPSLVASWDLIHDPSLKVADLACGTGNLTRQLKRVTGGKVIGVDLSAHMLDYARKLDEAEYLGIQYIRADCSKDLLKIPEIAATAPFDLINVAWLFEYASDLPTLQGMVANLYNLVKPGGRICTIAENTDLPYETIIAHQRYGMRFWGITDFSKAQVYDYKEKMDAAYSVVSYIQDPKVKPCVMGYYSWTLETIQKTFKEAGFSKFERTEKLICVADSSYEEDYYKLYTESPDMIVVKATR